jgi:agmatine/peptidylarginine deiminase
LREAKRTGNSRGCQDGCSNDIWIADHDFGYQIADEGHVVLAKVAFNVWDDDKEIEQQDEAED